MNIAQLFHNGNFVISHNLANKQNGVCEAVMLQQ